MSEIYTADGIVSESLPEEWIKRLNYMLGASRVTGVLLERIASEVASGTPPEWVFAAIEEAVLHGAPRWSYVAAILRAWKEEGEISVRKAADNHAKLRAAREEAEAEARREREREERLELERIRRKMEKDPSYQAIAKAYDDVRKRAIEVIRAKLRGEIEGWEADWELSKLSEEREALPPLPTPEEWRKKNEI